MILAQMLNFATHTNIKSKSNVNSVQSAYMSRIYLRSTDFNLTLTEFTI